MKLTEMERQRLEDLQADAAVFGLSPAEAAELDGLLVRAAESSQVLQSNAYEQLSARLLIASTEPSTPPDALLEQLEVQAAQFFEFDQAPPESKSSPQTPSPAKVRLELGSASDTRRRAQTASATRESVAWLLAAALAVLLVVSWISQSKLREEGESGSDSQAPIAPAVAGDDGVNDDTQDGTPEPTLQQQREQLLAADDVLQLDWLPSKDPAALVATGNVVWSGERQEGFLTFRNLAANDPAAEQYQLWIIDGERDPAQPVDGGVFDVQTTDDEVIVRIDAKLRVFDPQAFAVTIEKPGGVVVSERSRLPLLASRDAI